MLGYAPSLVNYDSNEQCARETAKFSSAEWNPRASVTSFISIYLEKSVGGLGRVLVGREYLICSLDCH